MYIPPESGMWISMYFPVVIANGDNFPPDLRSQIRSYQAMKSQVPLSTLSHTKGLNIFLSRKGDISLPFLKFFLNFTSDFLGLPSLTFSKRNQLSLLTFTEREMKRSKRMDSCRMIYPLQVRAHVPFPFTPFSLYRPPKWVYHSPLPEDSQLEGWLF